MNDYMKPPRPAAALPREITIIAEAHRVACQAADKRIVGPIRDAVELIVDLIEERGKRRYFDEQCDLPHDDSQWDQRSHDD